MMRNEANARPLYAQDTAAVLRSLKSGPAGLSAAEADRRRRRHGPNALAPRQGPGALARVLEQLRQPLVAILLVSIAASVLLGQLTDAMVIGAVVLVNAGLGFLQEAKALSALAALSRTLATEASVLRDGAWTVRPAEDLVPGDVVRLRAGDRVPADIRLTFAQALRLDESALTGESAPVDKSPDPVAPDTLLADRACMAFATTIVTHGQGRGLVAATGGTAEIGRIAALTAEADALATPLTRAIGRFSRLVLVGILALAGLTFVVGLARGEAGQAMFLAAVALAVGAIPEGLPAAVTVILAMGVSRMAARRAVIRHLPAVETLGSTTVICTDKTGTLTQNRMTVVELATAETTWHWRDGSLAPGQAGERAALESALLVGVLCNDAVLTGKGPGDFQGDPTEAALLVAAMGAGLPDFAALRNRLPRLAEEPFSCERRFMASLHDAGPGKARLVCLKGSVEVVLARCRTASGQDPAAATLRETAESMARRGLRVLALARKDHSGEARTLGEGDLEGGFVLAGLAAMIDPPRPGARAAVAACHRAGILVKMITGDHPATATAVAVGLDLGNGRPITTLTGRDIDAARQDSLPGLAAQAQVFARVSPEQKLRLVRALQSLGHVTAMTGDGVNDAPALRQADIGVAMGRGGTEAAKEAADMVLVDDDFATIEAAVEEGRGVFDNLTKCIVWSLPTNLGVGLVIVTAVLLGAQLPISALQILWINMTTAGSLGLMLAFEPREPGVMDRPPRDPGRPILDRVLIRRVLLVGTLFLAASFGLYAWELAHGASTDQARTVAVNVFVAIGALYLLNCRSLTRPALPRLSLAANPYVFLGLAGALGLQILFTYAPFMHKLFGAASIGPMAWLRVAGVAVVAFLTVEVEKRLFRPG